MAKRKPKRKARPRIERLVIGDLVEDAQYDRTGEVIQVTEIGYVIRWSNGAVTLRQCVEYVPSASEIESRAADIRSRWTKQQEFARRVQKTQELELPCWEFLLPDSLANIPDIW